jgi:hypothetical protein
LNRLYEILSCVLSQNHHHHNQVRNYIETTCLTFYQSQLPPSPTLTSGNPDLFSITIVVSLRWCYINGIIKYITLKYWLSSSFSIILLRNIHVFMYINSVILLNCWIVFYYSDVPQFVYPFIFWSTLGLFPVIGYYE